MKLFNYNDNTLKKNLITTNVGKETKFNITTKIKVKTL